MNDPNTKILWIALCKIRENAQQIDTTSKKIAIHKIQGAIDKNHVAYAISSNQPNLICFDYDFPDLNDLQLLRQIRFNHSNIPVIMLTMQHSENLAVWAFRTGVRNYLVKPLKCESIVNEFIQLSTLFKPDHSKPRINLLKSYQIPQEFHFLARPLTSKRTISAINHVEKYFHEKITEKEVAAICGMSIFTFSRMFHKEQSMTFREFLIQHRIVQAKKFLRNPKITITDVAQLSGFTDTSSFSRLFRRYVGMAPSNYQKSKLRPSLLT